MYLKQEQHMQMPMHVCLILEFEFWPTSKFLYKDDDIADTTVILMENRWAKWFLEESVEIDIW